MKDSQRGLRKGRACLAYLLELFKLVAANTNTGNAVDTVALGFSENTCQNS